MVKLMMMDIVVENKEYNNIYIYIFRMHILQQ